MPEEQIIRLRHFFEADIRMKELMCKMAPTDENCTDMIRYSDELEGTINYLASELEEFSIDIFKDESFVKKVREFTKELKNAFNKCSIDKSAYRQFFSKYLSEMNPEFIDKVKLCCKGYAFRGLPIEGVQTVNELLHLMHSAVVNNDKTYSAFPAISQKTNNYNYPISYRGELSPVFSNIFTQFPVELDVGWTDLLCVSENKMIMMVRDRGHALTIEINISGSTAIINYFIPRLLNEEMISKLPGINKFTDDFIGATGKFTVPVNDLPNSIYSFISMVPNEKIVDEMKNDAPIK